MNYHPALMSGPMVRATLEDLKTHTRRIIKGVDPEEYPYIYGTDDKNGKFHVTFSDAPYPEVIGRIEAKCPYGVPGDRIWIRETWGRDEESGNFVYRSTYSDGDARGGLVGKKWHPSIHMPRRASRIMLEITEVRVERLQAISEDDAEAEGVEMQFRTAVGQKVGPSSYHIPNSYRGGFANIWNRINGPYAWERNPWVWVIVFKRVKKP